MFYQDWKFWLVILSIIKDLALVIGIVLVKFNDMKHLNIDISKMSKKIDKLFTRLGKIERAQTKRDALCEERHK